MLAPGCCTKQAVERLEHLENPCTTESCALHFAVGVRQPAGTIHQYLAKLQIFQNKVVQNEFSSIEAESSCKYMSSGGIARFPVCERRSAACCSKQAPRLGAMGPQFSAHAV